MPKGRQDSLMIFCDFNKLDRSQEIGYFQDIQSASNKWMSCSFKKDRLLVAFSSSWIYQ